MPDERWSRLEVLQQIASGDDTWVDDWLRAQLDDCTATTVHTQLLVHRAWAIRGSG
ncbi:hypothetical protein [Kitasatospora sp. NPDC088351]|uniref:hypothetical protein n=1 Tax=Kitasatospora sp. NPDC088351 TaxID=3155180 RepID=UPI00344897FE